MRAIRGHRSAAPRSSLQRRTRIDRGRHHSLSGACLEGELFVHLAHRRRLNRHWGLAPSAGNQTAFPVNCAILAADWHFGDHLLRLADGRSPDTQKGPEERLAGPGFPSRGPWVRSPSPAPDIVGRSSRWSSVDDHLLSKQLVLGSQEPAAQPPFVGARRPYGLLIPTYCDIDGWRNC